MGRSDCPLLRVVNPPWRDVLKHPKVTPTGLERTPDSPKKTGSPRSEGAQEGAFRPKINQNLTALAEQLAALPYEQRKALLAMVRRDK